MLSNTIEIMHREPGNGILEDFRIDFFEFWQQLPNKGFFFFLLAAWLALFHLLGNSTFGYVDTSSLLAWMVNAYSKTQENTMADDGHGMLVPFLVLALFWWKRKQLVSQPLRTWSPALVIVALALLMHILGYVVQQPRVSIIGLFTGIFGLMGLAWGPAWLKNSLFPFFLFAFCVPLGSLAEPITFPLRLLVTWLVEQVSHLVLINVVREGTQLYDPTHRYQYEVAAACSGIRSLITIFLMSTAYGFVCFDRWWKRGAVVLSGVPLAVLGNLLRMLMIVVAAEMGGQDWGLYVHDSMWFSLTPYVLAFFGLFWIGHLLGEKPASKRPKPSEPTPAPAV
jgi:exosortase